MYLGIDLGTSEIKAVLLSSDGNIVGTAGVPCGVSRPASSWVEQNPSDWWAGTQVALANLRTRFPAGFSQIRGIGLSGQMHGAVLLDSRDRVLRPAILWNDMRSIAECRELNDRAPQLRAVAGNVAMPGFTAPSLMWVARNEPDIFRQTACVLLPKDYLRLRLTGTRATDPSDAAGTLWLDVAQRDWSDQLLSLSGMSRAQMPELLEGGESSGFVRSEIARDLGLPADVIVAAGGGDNATSAIGVGAIHPGDGFLSLGTSALLGIVTDRFRPDLPTSIQAFCHALPGRWNETSVLLSAASCLRWVCRLTSVDEATLLDEVAALKMESLGSAPIFLPYLSGERVAPDERHAQGSFFGLTLATDRAVIGYAILEGVALALAEGLERLQSSGANTSTLSLIGGGARSPLWAQLLANALNVRIQTHRGGDCGAALGAARLGWIAAGGHSQTILTRPAVNDEYTPNEARHESLLRRLSTYQDLCRLVRSSAQRS